MMSIFRRVGLLALILFPVSCVELDLPEVPEMEDVPVTVSFSVSDVYMTRSTLADEMVNQVKSMQVVVYNANGHLEGDTGKVEGTSSELALMVREGNRVYALANMPSYEAAPFEEDDFVSRIYGVSVAEMAVTGVPMCGMLITEADELRSGSVNVEVERLVTRVGFTLDRSLLSSSSLTVTSVRLRQTASAVAPFSGPFVAEKETAVDGDCSSDADIAAVNSGETIWFYAPENVQGVLLPNNDDPASKNPSAIGSKKEACTYLEVTMSHTGQYEGVDVDSDNLTYRFYLGKDNIRDFSLERNKGIHVKLYATDDGMYEDDWKVDYGEVLPVVTYQYDLTPNHVSPGSSWGDYCSVYYHQTKQFNLVQKKFVDGVLFTTRNVNSEATWTSSDTEVFTVENGLVYGVKTSSEVKLLTVVHNGYTFTRNIKVQDDIKRELYITPYSFTIQWGQTLDLRSVSNIYYICTVNGVETERRNVEDECTFWILGGDEIYVDLVDGCKVKGKMDTGSDSAAIFAEYDHPDGYYVSSDLYLIYVEDKVEYELEVTPSSATIDAEAGTQLKAIYYKVTNDTRDSGTDVTSSAAWSSSSDCASVNAGMVTGVKGGSATVTASYEGKTSSATITVNPKVTYTLELSVESSSVYVYYDLYITATRHKYLDGVYSSSDDVTASASWSSSSTATAVVSAGVVTGIKAGTATVTASHSGASDSATVTVQDLVTYGYRFFISGYNTVISGQETEQYKTYYYKDTYTNGALTAQGNSAVYYTGSVTWSVSSGSSYGTINSSGVLTGVAKGTVTIKASVSHEGQTYEFYKDVTVTDPSGAGPDTGWEDGGDVDYD